MREAIGKSDNRVKGTQPEIAQDAWLSRLGATLTSPVIVAALCIAAVLNLGFVFARLPAQEHRLDFSIYYAAATALRAGVNPYTTDLHPLSRSLGLDIGDQSHIADTPSFLFAFEPLARFSVRTAYWTWFALSLAALFAAMIFLLWPIETGALVLGALMLFYPPLANHFLYAQSQLFVLALLCIMLYCIKNANGWGAGLTLGIAGALRAFPLAMLGFLLLKRQWRPIVFAFLTMAVIGVATLLSLGSRICLNFSNGAHYDLQYRYLALPLCISLFGFISRSFWNICGPNLTSSFNIIRYLTIATADLLLLALSTRATLVSAGSRAFSLWVVTSVLLSPIAWFHYQVLFFILFAELAVAINQDMCSRYAIWAAAASYVSAVIVSDIMPKAFVVSQSPFWRWFGQLYFLSPLLAYLSAYWLAVDYPAVAISDTAGTEPELLGTTQA